MADNPYDIPALQQTLDKLSVSLEVLDGLNRRNKNQHRLSKWWAQFNMLRRGTRKVAEELQNMTQQLPTKKRVAGDSSTIARDLALKSCHLREQLVPRAYLAFTQLTADNQYAPLGLALLGVLAQIDLALSLLTPRDMHNAVSAVTEDSRCGVSDAGAEVQEALTDVGTAVSREDIASKFDVNNQPQSLSTTHVKIKAIRAKEEEETDQTSYTSRKEKPRHRGKRRKRDEFDDLFSSLT